MKRKRVFSESLRAFGLLVVIVFVAAGLLWLYTMHLSQPPTPPGKRDVKDNIVKKNASHKVAIVIDDIGYDLNVVKRLLAMDIPFTFAILPHCPYSRESRDLIGRAAKDILLHLPMEPQGYPDKDPGKGALFVSMTDRETIAQIEANIDAVSPIVGVNNHMGSRFMENEKKLSLLFRELKRRNLFFLDCATTRLSMGKKSAALTGVKFITRDIFLDNNQDAEETRRIIEDTLARRNEWKTIVMVGHPHESTIKVLEKARTLFSASNEVQIVPLSELVLEQRKERVQ